jgi:predicted deacetylase
VTPRLCIALHDVAPATWPQCARLLDLVDALGAPPVTLLVVPDWHGQGRIQAAPAFLRAIQGRIDRGDEIALHGYVHRDDAAAPRTPGAWFRRRVMTAGEGEFAELPCDIAQTRIDRGLKQLRRQGWQVDGFVPPAWLASAGTRLALQRSGLRWTSTHTTLIALPGEACGTVQRIAAPCLTASSRSAWRRLASRAWLRGSLSVAARTPLLRVGLHPADAQHEDLLACWRDVLINLLGRRQALTKSHALDVAACAAPARC